MPASSNIRWRFKHSRWLILLTIFVLWALGTLSLSKRLGGHLPPPQVTGDPSPKFAPPSGPMQILSEVSAQRTADNTKYTTPSCRRALIGGDVPEMVGDTEGFLSSAMRTLRGSGGADEEFVSSVEGPLEQLVPLLAVSLRREQLLQPLLSSHARMHFRSFNETKDQIKDDLFIASPLSASPLEFTQDLKQKGLLDRHSYREYYDALTTRLLLTSIEMPRLAPNWLEEGKEAITKHFPNFGLDNDDELPTGLIEESLYSKSHVNTHCQLESVDEKYETQSFHSGPLVGRRLTRIEQLLNVKHKASKARGHCDQLTTDFLYRLTGLAGPATTQDIEALLLFDVHQTMSTGVDRLVGIWEGCNVRMSNLSAAEAIAPALSAATNASVPAGGGSEVLLQTLPHQCRLRHVTKAFRRYLRSYIRSANSAALSNLLQEKVGGLSRSDQQGVVEFVESSVESPFSQLSHAPQLPSFSSLVGRLSPSYVPLWTLDVWEHQRWELFHGPFSAAALMQLDAALRRTLPSYVNHPFVLKRNKTVHENIAIVKTKASRPIEEHNAVLLDMLRRVILAPSPRRELVTRPYSATMASFGLNELSRGSLATVKTIRYAFMDLDALVRWTEAGRAPVGSWLDDFGEFLHSGRNRDGGPEQILNVKLHFFVLYRREPGAYQLGGSVSQGHVVMSGLRYGDESKAGWRKKKVENPSKSLLPRLFGSILVRSKDGSDLGDLKLSSVPFEQPISYSDVGINKGLGSFERLSDALRTVAHQLKDTIQGYVPDGAHEMLYAAAIPLRGNVFLPANAHLAFSGAEFYTATAVVARPLLLTTDHAAVDVSNCAAANSRYCGNASADDLTIDGDVRPLLTDKVVESEGNDPLQQHLLSELLYHRFPAVVINSHMWYGIRHFDHFLDNIPGGYHSSCKMFAYLHPFAQWAIASGYSGGSISSELTDSDNADLVVRLVAPPPSGAAQELPLYPVSPAGFWMHVEGGWEGATLEGEVLEPSWKKLTSSIRSALAKSETTPLN